MDDLADVGAAITRERAALLPDARIYPVAVLPSGVPIDVAALIMRGLADNLEREGWHAHFRTGTGLAVVWVRPIATPPPATDPATDPADTPDV